MLSAEEATKKFMEDLENGKFKRPKIPNPPPYYEGDEADNKEVSENFDKFLNSDLFKEFMDLE